MISINTMNKLCISITFLLYQADYNHNSCIFIQSVFVIPTIAICNIIPLFTWRTQENGTWNSSQNKDQCNLLDLNVSLI